MRAGLPRWMVCLSLLCAVFDPALAHANGVADEADLKFYLGAEAYQRGDYRGALEHFLASNRLVPNRNVVYNVARCYEELKQYPEAYRYFTLALQSETSPAARERIERALSQLRLKVVVLQVSTEPPGATVFVDRRDLGSRGSAPVALGLKPGTYSLLAELAGHHPARVEVPALKAGESRSVGLTLQPILGDVAIEDATPGALVRADDVKQGKGCVVPCSLKLPEGRHTLFFERAGYHPAQQDVEVRAERRARVRAQLVALTGSLLVSTDEPGALVEVDDKPRGFTPLVLSLPVGKRRLRLSLAGYRTIEREVMVSHTRELRVDLALTLTEEVTAASRSTEAVDQAPSSVTIIPRRELTALGYPTIAEALRGVPGVYSWNDRTYQAVGFRGLGRLGSYGNRVLVLVDGHPLNDDWLGSSYVGYDARTSLDDVERIEVVRGPGSVLYGTSAFSGVINLVTRRARERGSEVAISTAEGGVARGRVRANVPLGPHSALWASAAIGRSSGRNFFFPELQQSSRGADGFEVGTLEGRFHHGWFSAGWYLQTHHKNLPTGEYETILADPRTAQSDTRASLELKAEPGLGPLRTMTRLHANHYRFHGGYAREPGAGGLERDTFRGSWVGLEERLELQAAPGLKLTLGGEGQLHFQIETRAVDERTVLLRDSHPHQVGAAYALVDVSPSERLHLSAGARLDAYSTFGSSLNPRIAIVAKPYAEGNTKLMVGKAFRAPSVYELYYNDGGITQVASPDIEPESVYSAELEHTHRLSPTVTATGAVFANLVKDLVLTSGSGSAPDPLSYVNSQAPIATVGAELGLKRDWRQGYMLALSYSFQRSRFLADGALSSLLALKQSPDFRRVANSPGHLASLKGALPLLGRTLTLASRLSVESGRYDRNEQSGGEAQLETDAFAVWDVVLTGREERHRFSWAAGVYNAFDWRYALPVSAEFPQRTIAQDGRTFALSTELAF